MFWSDVIDLLRALIFSVAHVCNGSVGVAVILISFTIRAGIVTAHPAPRTSRAETPAAVGRTQAGAGTHAAALCKGSGRDDA